MSYISTFSILFYAVSKDLCCRPHCVGWLCHKHKAKDTSARCGQDLGKAIAGGSSAARELMMQQASRKQSAGSQPLIATLLLLCTVQECFIFSHLWS